MKRKFKNTLLLFLCTLSVIIPSFGVQAEPKAIEIEEFDISSGIKTRASEGSAYLETDHFTIYFPGDISWDYESVDNNTLIIYYTPAKDAGFGGRVVTIKAYDWADNSYEDIPEYSIAGLDSEKKYVAIFPTDLQYDPSDSTQEAEYGRMLKVAKRMDCEDEKLTMDNPFDVIG
ncbi:MAG: hypothetical protein Q4C50_09550 [Eubacteriales bacterium]|nr:hypothetical protein [Eubacteriales bacterium]